MRYSFSMAKHVLTKTPIVDKNGRATHVYKGEKKESRGAKRIDAIGDTRGKFRSFISRSKALDILKKNPEVLEAHLVPFKEYLQTGERQDITELPKYAQDIYDALEGATYGLPDSVRRGFFLSTARGGWRSGFGAARSARVTIGKDVYQEAARELTQSNDPNEQFDLINFMRTTNPTFDHLIANHTQSEVLEALKLAPARLRFAHEGFYGTKGVPELIREIQSNAVRNQDYTTAQTLALTFHAAYYGTREAAASLANIVKDDRKFDFDKVMELDLNYPH